jgi:hypothetical protein
MRSTQWTSAFLMTVFVSICGCSGGGTPAPTPALQPPTGRPGLTLDQTTGVITGTPTATAAASACTITAASPPPAGENASLLSAGRALQSSLSLFQVTKRNTS